MTLVLCSLLLSAPHGFSQAQEADVEKNNVAQKVDIKTEAVNATVDEAERTADQWDAKFQSTYVWQTKPPFPALYSGPNSLSPQHETSYSFTATAFLGMRLWDGGELYLNPELVQGVPMSNLSGLGGLTNGELQKSAGGSFEIMAGYEFDYRTKRVVTPRYF